MKPLRIQTTGILIFTSILFTQTIHAQVGTSGVGVSASCVNEDFEISNAGAITNSTQVNGWHLTSGYNGTISASNTSTLGSYFPGGLSGANSCNFYGCCPMPPNSSEIINCGVGGYIDNLIGSQYPIYSVFGTALVAGASAQNPQINNGLFGTKVLRLNNEVKNDFSITRLSKTFSITSSNALLQFAYLPVLSKGHSCCEAGAFQIRLIDVMANTVIPCPGFTLSAALNSCGDTDLINYFNVGSGSVYNAGADTGYVYHPWKVHAIDLTAYIGQNIMVDFLVSDCTIGDHFTYVYFDALCRSLNLSANGSTYDASANIDIKTCGPSTICVPDGMAPCAWTGAGVPSNYTVLSYTNACFTTSSSGVYTVQMFPKGACAPIQRVLSNSVTPALQIGSPGVFDLCNTTQVQISPQMTGPSAGYSFTWEVPASATVSGVNSPVLTTNAAGVYTVTTSNQSNTCTSTTQLTVGICIGLEEEKKSDLLSLFPNPTKGVFYIETKEKFENYTVELFNIYGEVIFTITIDSPKTEIDLQNYGAGIYFLRTKINKKPHYFKIIKN